MIHCSQSFSKNRQLLAVVIGTLFLTSASFASMVIKVDPDRRVKASISYDSMNRIAFANDRIVQIFGDEEAYTLQSDETRGQIFLKPTAANGDKPIYVTLTTEQGKVQDMELIPQKIPTSTIILKGEGGSKPGSDPKPVGFSGRGGGGGASAFSPSPPSLGSSPPQHPLTFGTDRAAPLIRALREVASQDMAASDSETEAPPPMTVSNLKVEGVRVIHQQGLSVSVYKLTNTSEGVYEVVENAFNGQAVLAISVESRQLKPKESTRVFIVRAI